MEQYDKWQPIETVPMDGTRVLVFAPRSLTNKGIEDVPRMEVDGYQSRYESFGKFNKEFWPATHWMPLPEPPKGVEHE